MIDRYLQNVRAVRRLSSATVRAYESDLERFRLFCEARGIEPARADRLAVRAFISELTRDGLTAATVNRMLSALKGFYRYLIRNNLRDASPLVGLASVKMRKSLPQYFSRAELESMLASFGDDFRGVRDRLVLELLYSTGCRVSELVGIDVHDVALADGTIKVLGKGNKERIVFLVPSARDAVRTWMPVREARKDPDDADAERALILNAHGRRMTARGAFFLVRRMTQALEAGGRSGVGPHTVRHSFATHILDGGADIRVVQELLGHANLSTTQVYTHTGIDRLASAYAKAHPHARKGGRNEG